MWKSMGSVVLVLLGLWAVQYRWFATEASGKQRPLDSLGAEEAGEMQDRTITFWRLAKPGQTTITINTTAMASPLPRASAAPMSGFQAPVRYDVMGRAGAQIMVDLDGDRRDEIVVAAAEFPPSGQGLARGVVNVFKAQTDGRVQLWKTQTLPDAPDYMWGGIASGDFNWDGRKDLVISMFSGIAVLTSHGDGSFNVEHANVGRSIHQVAVLDVDLDGNLDMVGLSWGYIMGHDPIRDGPSTAATIFFGTGFGGVSRTQLLATPQRGYNDLKVADANGDGFNDLLISSRQAFHFWVVPHDQRGGFGAPVAYSNPSSDTIGSIVAGDFDGDGRIDIVVANPANSPSAALWLYRQAPTGSLEAPVRYASLDIPGPMLGADFNNDRLIDVGVLHEGWDYFGVYMQDAQGLNPTEHLFRVVPPLSYNADHYNRSGVSVGSLNGDDCPDVAMSDLNYGLIVLLSTGCQPSPPRVTGGQLPPRLQ